MQNLFDLLVSAYQNGRDAVVAFLLFLIGAAAPTPEGDGGATATLPASAPSISAPHPTGPGGISVGGGILAPRRR